MLQGIGKWFIILHRAGIVLSVLWIMGIGDVAAYEWLAEPPASGPFVELVIQKTGESFSSLQGNMLADLVQVERHLKWKPFGLALIVPVVALWLVGSLLWWVLSGFRREQT